MRTIQDKLTAELEALFSDLGLEVVQAATAQNARGNLGRLLVMDGQDTRLSLGYLFQDEEVLFEISGEAVDAGYPAFFQERSLFPTHLGRSHYEQSWRVRYTDGDRTRKLFDLLLELLRPYEKNTEEN